MYLYCLFAWTSCDSNHSLKSQVSHALHDSPLNRKVRSRLLPFCLLSSVSAKTCFMCSESSAFPSPVLVWTPQEFEKPLYICWIRKLPSLLFVWGKNKIFLSSQQFVLEAETGNKNFKSLGIACCLCVSRGPVAETTEMPFCLCRCWLDLDYEWSCKSNCYFQNMHQWWKYSCNHSLCVQKWNFVGCCNLRLCCICFLSHRKMLLGHLGV